MTEMFWGVREQFQNENLMSSTAKRPVKFCVEAQP